MEEEKSCSWLWRPFPRSYVNIHLINEIMNNNLLASDKLYFLRAKAIDLCAELDVSTRAESLGGQVVWPLHVQTRVLRIIITRFWPARPCGCIFFLNMMLFDFYVTI